MNLSGMQRQVYATIAGNYKLFVFFLFTINSKIKKIYIPSITTFFMKSGTNIYVILENKI